MRGCHAQLALQGAELQPPFFWHGELSATARYCHVSTLAFMPAAKVGSRTDSGRERREKREQSERVEICGRVDGGCCLSGERFDSERGLYGWALFCRAAL